MTEQTPARAPEDFNLFDPEVQSDPYDFYRAMHAQCPVHKLPQNGFFLISKYEDLRTALRNPETFSNVLDRAKMLQKGDNSKLFMDILRARGWEHVPTLQRSDPPQHARYRRIVDRMLGPRYARALVPRTEALAAELVEKALDKGAWEFVAEFAIPFPGIIIAEQIGLDGSDYLTFKRWADNLMSYGTRVLDAEEMRQAAETELEMQHTLAALFDDRRKAPRDDLLSELVRGPGEGEEPLSPHELQNVMHQLIAGGYETTTSALTHMMWQLVRFPDVVAALRADRALVKNFCEESLRWESPVQGLFRTTKTDTELHGTEIPAGSFCLVRYGAANRDAEKFPAPEIFDIHRSNASQHLAFGAGTHFCPGAQLARQEMQIACNAILDRMEHFRLARPMPHPPHRPSINFIPVKELWVGFDRRS